MKVRKRSRKNINYRFFQTVRSGCKNMEKDDGRMETSALLRYCYASSGKVW
jgi:hypothetical protein